ncbi:MAG: bifunctional demethylmenaquinone methyltransferase/2-methoxy-6-polyprenyl-1,4-benzoquinol methylase UbiE [bacterium]
MYSTAHPYTRSSENIHLMFDRIAARYDFLNGLLSFRCDTAWRKRVALHLPRRSKLFVLDLATGTGDLIIAIIKECTAAVKTVGMDISREMLKIGKEKIKLNCIERKVDFVRGNAQSLNFPDNTFDAATMGFGIRNVEKADMALNEIYRVLKPGGRAVILEFSLPANRVFRFFYLFYFRIMVPFIGALLSGDSHAYRYLNRSVEAFPHGQAFCEFLVKSGFSDVHFTALGFGIATIYQGDKKII